MPKFYPTIYNVAAHAGVSISTVSRVLNDPHKVNGKTRTAVLKAIEELGFVPKADARARALRSTGRIGVLIPFFTAPSFVQRLRGIASVLNQKNFELVIYPVDTYERTMGYLGSLPIHRNLDGLIIVSQVVEPVVAARLQDNYLETVMIESSHPNFTTLQIDDHEGGEIAARYLLDKGHQRFAFAGGADLPTFGHDPIKLRLEGYKQCLEAAGMELPDCNIHLTVTQPREVMKSLIKEGTPLAIFSATDLQAFSLIKEARSLGLRIPEDIAIIGFDDIDMAAFMGLTTVHQPLDESGQIAAELLLSRLENPERSIQHIKLPLQIIGRETA